jgi:hypothetical protein
MAASLPHPPLAARAAALFLKKLPVFLPFFILVSALCGGRFLSAGTGKLEE